MLRENTRRKKHSVPVPYRTKKVGQMPGIDRMLASQYNAIFLTRSPSLSILVAAGAASKQKKRTRN